MAFGLAFIPRFLLIFGVVPLRTVTDEMITIAGGAYFAGLDWSAILSYSGRYYGSGFTMLFSWIFKLTDNPIIIYRVILTGCVIVQALVALICFDIMYKSLGIHNKKFVCVASISCSYCVVTRATIVYNEHILIFISWLIAWVLIKLVERDISDKKKIGYSFVLISVLVYSLTVHTRSYTYWISVAMVVILYYWTYRKSFLSIKVVGIGCLGGGAVYGLLDILKKGMYLVQDGEYLSNSKVYVSGVHYILSSQYWEGWLNIVLGQINTISVITGGLIVIGIVLGAALLWNGLMRKKTLVSKNGSLDVEKIYWIVCVFFGAAIVMTILAQSFSWLSGVGNEMMGISTEGGYPYKAFTYVRYFGPYCGPVLMIILSFLYQFRSVAYRYIKVAIGILMGIHVYWVMVIVPRICNNKYPVEAFLPFCRWNFSETPRLRTYLAGTVVLVIFVCVFLWLYRRKKMILITLMLMVLLSYQYIYNAIYYDNSYRNNINYEACEESYDLIKSLEKEVELPKKVYVVDGREIENQQIFYEYQFLLNRYKIIPGMPEENEAEAIVLSNTNLEMDDSFKAVKLDEDVFVYVKGKEIQEKIEHGY